MGQYQRAEVICQCVFIWVTLQIQGRSASTLYSRSEKLQLNWNTLFVLQMLPEDWEFQPSSVMFCFVLWCHFSYQTSIQNADTCFSNVPVMFQIKVLKSHFTIQGNNKNNTMCPIDSVSKKWCLYTANLFLFSLGETLMLYYIQRQCVVCGCRTKTKQLQHKLNAMSVNIYSVCWLK